MDSTKNKLNFIIIFWVVVLVIAIFIGWYFFVNKSPVIENIDRNQTATTTVPTQTTNPTNNSNSTGAITEIAPGIFVTQTQPQKVNTVAPSLNRPTPDTSKLDSGMVSRTQADITIRIANLTKDKTSFQDWISIGFDWKALGDYDGAKEAWEYVSLLYPQNLISFGNLGDLYANFLNNNIKAEIAYKTAIKNSPNTIDNYRNLFNLYVSEQKNAEAVALLKDGIAKNPNSFSLQLMLARYYRDAGNIVSASLYYDQAITIAQKDGNIPIVESLKTEKSEMK